MHKVFCLFGVLFFALVNAQVVVPTFGIRGNVPETLIEEFMIQFRQDLRVLGVTDLEEGELIPPGIAGSLEPQWAYLAAEIESVRYAVLGEIQESQTAYAVNILIGDREAQRSSDIMSEPLDPAQLSLASVRLAQSVKDFLQPLAPLPKGSAGLFVSSRPSGATLLINGIEQGITGQLDVINLRPGSYQLEVRLEGYLPSQQRIELVAERIEPIHLDLYPAAGGSLQVLSVPSAEVFIDDVAKGFTPLTVEALPGIHKVRLRRPGFEDAVSDHLVKDNRVSRVGRVILQPQFERMIYWDASAAPLMRLDGVVQTSSFAQLSPGIHTIEVSREGETLKLSFEMPEVGVLMLDLQAGDLKMLDLQDGSLKPYPQQ